MDIFFVWEKKREPNEVEHSDREPDKAERLKDQFDESLNDWWDEHPPDSSAVPWSGLLVAGPVRSI